MLLRDENSAGVAGLTHCGLFSLVTHTVSRATIIVAEWNTDTGEVPLRVETLLVFIRTDCGVLTLVNISAALIVLSQRVAGITADMTARGVEAVLALRTD